MAIRSKDCYSLLNAAVGKVFSSLGFKKSKGTVLGFAKAEETGFLTVWFQVDKWGWDEKWGSQFTVEFQRASSPEPGAGGFDSRKRIGALLEGHPQIEEIRELNDNIIGGLPGHVRNQGQFAVIDGQRIQIVGVSPSTEPYEGDVWLHYYSESDLENWGKYLANHIARFIDIFEKPIHSPMQEARNRFNAALTRSRSEASVNGNPAAAVACLRLYIQSEPEARFRSAAQSHIDALLEAYPNAV